MFNPTKEDFKKKAKEGNLIAVSAEIMADLETPVSAFLKLGGGPQFSAGERRGRRLRSLLVLGSAANGVPRQTVARSSGGDGTGTTPAPPRCWDRLT
jgi:hypothetical protein